MGKPTVELVEVGPRDGFQNLPDFLPTEKKLAVIAQLIDAGVMVSGFMREKGSLETLFMQITGQEEEKAVIRHEMESGI